jgi:hypothetical protein
MWSVIRSILLTALLTAPLASSQAEELSNDDIRSLDDQVQDAKSVALDIAAELNMLEERLLYPSGTQLSIYLSIAGQRGIRPSSVEIRINGELAANHIYGVRELEALQNGGIQELYAGNVKEGSHELSVKVIGNLNDGAEFAETGQHVFTKGVESKTLSIRLAQPGDDGNGILIGDR